ncbi:MAG TPA: O-antigen ligase family protein [Blastocatellia bacterium]|nr:O-antigen ligase family protein [Blastocatellia bacterium]
MASRRYQSIDLVKAADDEYAAPDEGFESVRETRTRIPLRLRLARKLNNAVFWGALLTIMVFAVPYGSVEAWWEASFECTAYLLTGLWIIEGSISGIWFGPGRRSASRLALPLLAIVAFAFLQSWAGTGFPAGADGKAWDLFSADPYATLQFSYKLLALILTGALLVSHTTTPRRLRLLLVVIVGIGIISAFFGILRQTVQRDDGFILFYLRPGEGFAQFINRNHFAFLMEMTLGLVIGLLVGGGMHHERLLVYFAAAAPLWSALVLSNSRGGICSLLAQVLFLALVSGVNRTAPAGSKQSPNMLDWLGRAFRSLAVRGALIVVLIAATGAGILWLGGDPLAGRLETLPGEIKAQGQGVRRIEVWSATWELIKAHPVLGSGFSAYGMAINQYHRSSGELIPRDAHNDYLELLASGGLTGLGLAAWFIVVLIQRARQKLRTGDRLSRAACLGALIGLFGVAFHNLVDFGLHITINALICISLVAIIAIEDGFENQIN